MEKRYLTVAGATARYGPRPSAWRKWIRTKQLGNAVVRFGKLVFLDSVVLDERIANSGKLLVNPQERDAKLKTTVPATESLRVPR